LFTAVDSVSSSAPGSSGAESGNLCWFPALNSRVLVQWHGIWKCLIRYLYRSEVCC
jgi:hypothetical protein